jgi:hypothetical protein
MELLIIAVIVITLLVIASRPGNPTARRGLSGLFSRCCPSCRTLISNRATHCPHCTQATGWGTSARNYTTSHEVELSAQEYQWQGESRKNGPMSPMKAFFIVFGILATVMVLVTSYAARAEPQTTFRDASGHTTGTAATDSQGTTTFRDASGRTTGTATFSNQGSAGGTTTFRDNRGMMTGTASTPWDRR